MIAASRSLAEGAAPRVEGPVQLSAETVWSEVSARLKQTLSDGPYAQWFSGATGALQEAYTYDQGEDASPIRQFLQGLDTGGDLADAQAVLRAHGHPRTHVPRDVAVEYVALLLVVERRAEVQDWCSGCWRRRPRA